MSTAAHTPAPDRHPDGARTAPGAAAGDVVITWAITIDCRDPERLGRF